MGNSNSQKRKNGWNVNSGDFSITLIGKESTGKSQLTSQFVEEKFNDLYDPTIEDQFRKETTLKNKERITIKVLDTGGSDITDDSMRASWIKNNEGFGLVYSVTDRSSFDAIQKYFDEIIAIKKAQCGPMILIGNKADSEERDVKIEEGEALAKKLNNIPFLETSAKNRINVDEAFEILARECVAYGHQIKIKPKKMSVMT